MNCPLCGAEAQTQEGDFGRRRVIACRDCGEYAITHAAADRLARAPKEWRDGYVELVRSCPQDKRLLIRLSGDPARPLTTELEDRHGNRE